MLLDVCFIIYNPSYNKQKTEDSVEASFPGSNAKKANKAGLLRIIAFNSITFSKYYVFVF